MSPTASPPASATKPLTTQCASSGSDLSLDYPMHPRGADTALQAVRGYAKPGETVTFVEKRPKKAVGVVMRKDGSVHRTVGVSDHGRGWLVNSVNTCE